MKLCLIIAENEVKRASMRDVIEDLGFVALEAANSDSAYMTANGLLPDAIVVDDEGVAGFDGMALAENLRVLKNGKRPFILYTGKPDMNVLAHHFLQHNLLAEQARYAVGL